VISPSQGPLPDNTQHFQETDIHGTVAIRTHNLRKRSAADLRRAATGTGPLYLYTVIFTRDDEFLG